MVGFSWITMRKRAWFNRPQSYIFYVHADIDEYHEIPVPVNGIFDDAANRLRLKTITCAELLFA
jgi:hypothetical protein